MKGRIRKRGSSCEVVVHLGRDATTGKKYKSYTVRGTKKQAEAKLAQVVHELNTGEYVEPSKLTFGEYLDRWLADYVRPNLRPKCRCGSMVTSATPEGLAPLESEEAPA